MAISLRALELDPDTWMPTSKMERIKTVSVSRSDNRDGSNPLIESGDITADEAIEEGYYRIESIEDGHPVQPVATLLLVPDEDEFAHMEWTGCAIAKSVLAPAAERKFDPGAKAIKGCDGAQWVADRLREVIAAPVVVDGSFILDRHVVIDPCASYIDGCWQVLDSAGWCLQITESGIVHVMPIPSEPSITYDSSLVMDGLKRSLPIDTVPNVVRLWEGDDVTEARNDDPKSPTSIASRGRQIDYVEEDPALVDGETLENCAKRKLNELSVIYEIHEMERYFVAGALPYTCVYVFLPEASTQCACSVMRQDIKCGIGIRVKETLGRRAYG